MAARYEDHLSGLVGIVRGRNGAGYLATSATSLTCAGSGSKAFTTQIGLAYTTGARIRATSTGSGDWMEGLVTAYSGSTLTVTMDLNSGTGTRTDWDINLAGQRGSTGATGPGYTATSATSRTCAGSGSKPFTTQAGLAYSVGARLRATSIGSGDWMEGVVTSYSSTTLVATMDLNSGTGTHADWNINLAGQRGATGAAGPGYTATSATSLDTAGSGSQSFTTQAGLAYSVGARIRATSTGTSEWMEGVVTSYSSTTLVATMDLNSGTGTHTDWNINVAGQAGAGGGSSAVVRAHATASPTMTHSAVTIIDYDTVDRDPGSLVTTGSSWKMTAAVAGDYLVSASALLASFTYADADLIQLIIYKNGTLYSHLEYRTLTATFTDPVMVNGADIISLAIGDYIHIGLGFTVASNLDGAIHASITASHISVAMVG